MGRNTSCLPQVYGLGNKQHNNHNGIYIFHIFFSEGIIKNEYLPVNVVETKNQCRFLHAQENQFHSYSSDNVEILHPNPPFPLNVLLEHIHRGKQLTGLRQDLSLVAHQSQSPQVLHPLASKSPVNEMLHLSSY